MASQRARVFFDLQRQLPGWRQHERTWGALQPLSERRAAEQTSENGDEKHRAFAGAGLSPTGAIHSFQRVGQYCRLHRRAILKTEIEDAMHDFIGQIEIMKTHFSFNRLHRKHRSIPGGNALRRLALDSQRVASLCHVPLSVQHQLFLAPLSAGAPSSRPGRTIPCGHQ